MNNLHRDLLNDSTADFRNQLLAKTVATSRRSRRTRTLAKISFLCAAACMLLALPFVSRLRTANNVATNLRPSPSSALSSPLASSALNPHASSPTYTILHTKPFPNLLHTTPLPATQFASSSTSIIQTIHTSGHAKIEPISDQQLLSLFADHPVALVSTPRGAQLIFLDSAAPGSNN